ncbi:CDP-diacylglycerol--glycerol-3-phosphate 3-phosphatidyltransferase [Corallococcus sp. H22C18031201]|uniref:CDP-diacylglycerol--glycerol-3-phosphate 3-phosphatidyltransferase n=1 Tax=Citreicoccus inhibens TaxID=2849499 RepID=UPI000E7127DA|nr:CDP-diacylglycerol--glycerol-3-phosphate 3-phosphatidyltransferase [Citreicoccus inhibens]MBJ6764042.1 CDP-diacylglycerol--glycerol-3-phosphate 3-phosphatidyltransferase [Myxococcaceae bacterium JPH2]MBU8896548.1 CDP-diacylglycerol--glycerol-3-phosphate 3-phosphatidyltransferase [Citreicoccus inhibens]RJS18742.1 CDP-diacylglycerol--glycerol-3-phosphate 3-phosphatidyltransferase [Corallococcus sp. H22C18031201]
MAIDRATRKQRREERARRRAERRPSVLVQEFWNLPNMLTLGRILLIPVFVWLTYDADPLHSLAAAAVFAVASITDVIDGYLARRWNLITVVGKFMDPLADKLIAMAALVMMVRLGRIAAWVVIVLLAREFIVSGLRTIAASEGMVIAAGQEGKWKTSLQLVGIISLCVHYVHPLDLGFRTVPVDYNQVGKVLVYLSGAFSLWSAVVYFRAFLAMLARRGGAAADAKSV